MLVQPAFGQRLLAGSVLEAESRSPLPAATVYIEGTMTGTIANADGAFQLQLPETAVTVVFRYIGYESERLEISAGPVEPLVITLPPVSKRCPNAGCTSIGRIGTKKKQKILQERERNTMKSGQLIM